MSDENVIRGDETQKHNIVLVPEPSAEKLNERQRIDYRDHRESLVRWMLNIGKNPTKAEGYAFETARRRAHQLDRFYRWVWDREDGYTTRITHDHADAFSEHLAYEDHSETHKANAQKALKMYFRWRDDTDEWNPEITFSGDDGRGSPRDYLTREERGEIREAALELGTVPAYGNMSAAERREWERLLAQRLRKPIDDIGPEDFDRANGFKIPSLVWTSLDTGLRPIEVGRATVEWVDTDNGVLRIPKGDSTKNREDWTPALKSKTATMLERWLTERRLYPKYNDTDRLWLNRAGNPYNSDSLRYLLDRLCEVAEIDTEHRSLTWYAIRHSVGTYMAREEGLEAAASQLRHQSVTTTRKYDQAPIEDRRAALDRME
jgi:integrase